MSRRTWGGRKGKSILGGRKLTSHGSEMRAHGVFEEQKHIREDRAGFRHGARNEIPSLRRLPGAEIRGGTGCEAGWLWWGSGNGNGVEGMERPERDLEVKSAQLGVWRARLRGWPIDFFDHTEWVDGGMTGNTGKESSISSLMYFFLSIFNVSCRLAGGTFRWKYLRGSCNSCLWGTVYIPGMFWTPNKTICCARGELAWYQDGAAAWRPPDARG